MLIYVTGVFAFIFFDYVLVLGKWGFPELKLNGSSIASIIQYSIVIILSITYILTNFNCKKYFSTSFFKNFNKRQALRIINLSWPIMIDKIIIALSYIWLLARITPMGKYAIASFDVIKNLELFALLPALAFSQILTFLVSNKLGEQSPEGAKTTIKRILLLSSLTVAVLLFVLCYKSEFFIGLFDPKRKFTHIAAPSLILVSFLVIFDIVQLTLAGALRGAGDVKTVMWSRFIACAFFFAPLSYFLSHISISNYSLKIALIYGSFYLGTLLMGIIFIRRLRGDKWQKINV